jgi:hypothetical protein
MSLPTRLACPRVYIEQLRGQEGQPQTSSLVVHEAFFKQVPKC